MIISIPGIVSQGGGFPSKGKPLNDYTWDEISLISQAGLAGEYFVVGDRKAVTLNGTVGTLTFNNQTYYCGIIGINHNSALEGTNRIHMQLGYTALSGGSAIAFVDSGYSTEKKSGIWFNIYNSALSSGGWANSSMRTVICEAFQNAMPSALQNVLQSVTKYSDNTGGGPNTASYVTATEETISLLAEYEVFGSRRYANNAEQNYQAQYSWYAQGNSKIRYRHDNTAKAVDWWERSTYVGNNRPFCCVSSSGATDSEYSSYSLGFAPIFFV